MGLCPVTIVKKCLPIFIGVLMFLFLLGGVSAQGMKCSGYCTKDALKCQLRGGKIIGYCSKTLMCCDPLVSASGSCGDKKSGQKVVFFKSPSFPLYAAGDLLCELKVRIRNDTLAIRIDFLQVEMDGLSFDNGGENSATCDSDIIFIRGFQTWAPPGRCGNLTGYGVLIDMDTRQTRSLGMLSIVALMSSPKYRFNMRITQTTKNPDLIWDVKDSFIAKRSVTSKFMPTSIPNPTKVLIRTGKPAIFPTESSTNVENFKTFDSLYPDKEWQAPSVVNGEDTVISTVPWQVSIRIKPQVDYVSDLMDSMDLVFEESMENYTSMSNCSESEGTHFCGGSIFGDGRYILSAAHCFFGSSKLEGMVNVSSIVVVVGDTNKCSDDDETGIFNDEDSGRLKSYRYGVESIVFHYGYDHSLLINDIAILRLNETIKYYDHVKPIVLANPGEDFEGQQALVSGWGDRFADGNSNETLAMEEPGGPDLLQSTKLLEIQNRSFCNERDNSQLGGSKAQVLAHPKYLYVFDSTVCTLTKNGSTVVVNTGRGDSGGPLIVYKNQSQPVLVGIVSYSIPVDDKVEMYDGVNRTVDFYTSVAFYRNWVDLVVKSFNQQLTRQM